MNERIDLSAINKQFNCSITVTLVQVQRGFVSHIGTQKLTAIYI